MRDTGKSWEELGFGLGPVSTCSNTARALLILSTWGCSAGIASLSSFHAKLS